MSLRPIGYVVIVYNVASGHPHVNPFGPTIYASREEALEAGREELRDYRANGRRELVTVAAVLEVQEVEL